MIPENNTCLPILRIPDTLEDIANSKKNLRRQAFSVENIDVNYENYSKKDQDYQNVPLADLLKESNDYSNFNEPIDYQNVEYHTYQNVHKNLVSRVSKASANNSLDNKDSIIESELPLNSNLKQSCTEDDGLYELCNSQYSLDQSQALMTISSQELRAKTKTIFTNSSYDTKNKNNSKFIVIVVKSMVLLRKSFIFHFIYLIFFNFVHFYNAGNHYGTPKPSKESKPSSIPAAMNCLPTILFYFF